MSNEFEETDQVTDEEVLDCKLPHVDELDEPTKRFMSVFATIRSKNEDLARAESDIKRFELSIESDRKRLQKTLEAAKVGLRNARVQMAVELEKLDAAGFTNVSKVVKDLNAV